MALRIADRVRETTTTTGTGAITLAGAVAGHIAFSAIPSIATNDTVYYAIVSGSNWEVGLGTYSGANTLTRTTVHASSNAGSAINLSGTSDVWLDLTAAHISNLGLKYLTEALNSASPNNVVPVVSLTPPVGSFGHTVALAPTGFGAVQARVGDGTSTGGNRRGDNAVDWQIVRGSATQVASGTTSTIGGGTGNSATNTSSTVAGGSGNLASGNGAAAGGGYSNTASGSASTCGGGESNTSSGAHSTVVGGRSNTASGDYSMASGYLSTTRGLRGARAHGSSSLGNFGDVQNLDMAIGNSTTNATPTVLTSSVSSAGTTNQYILPNNGAATITGKVVARSSTGDVASWTFSAAIKRGANAASTAMVAACTPVQVAADAGASTWALTVDADTTNGGLRVTFTGAAATNIRIAGHLDGIETIY